MSLPANIAAYDDCYAIYDDALAQGTRVAFKIYADANIFMMRMHQARSLLRKEAQRIYEPNDRRWGKTDYDKLIVRHPIEDTEGTWWVYIEIAGSNILAIERLPKNLDSPLLQLTGPDSNAKPTNSN